MKQIVLLTGILLTHYGKPVTREVATGVADYENDDFDLVPLRERGLGANDRPQTG